MPNESKIIKYTNRLQLFVLGVAMSLFMDTTASAQSTPTVDSLEYNLDFRVDKSDVDPSYKDNAEVLSEIDSLLTDLRYISQLDSLSVSITASPEAPYEYNVSLLKRRVASIESLLLERYPSINLELFNTSYYVYRWSEVLSLINADPQVMPHKEEMVKIFDDPATTESQKEYKVRNFSDKAAWNYIKSNYLTQLRRTMIKTEIISMPIYADIDEMLSSLQPLFPEPTFEPITPLCAPEKEIEYIYERKPLLAFKTNLLYDLVTALNISVEVPIGKRVSIAGEWIFPWWIWDDGTEDSKRHRLQLLYGNLEARYWFGNRDERPVMTGWYAGIYSGGGKFDFEYNRSGVQGEFFVAAGLSGGYAHSINKMNTLRMEYSLSLGYVKTTYRDYNSIYGSGVDFKWHPIRRSTGEYSLFSPTAAKVSLAWMLFYNKKRRIK